MQKFKSHKVVEAAKIARISLRERGSDWDLWLIFEDTSYVVVPRNWADRHAPRPEELESLVGGYLVRYLDGYTSWSPAEAFEEGYTSLVHDPKDGALPVSGYKPQTQEKVAIVNGFKEDEERLLRSIENLQARLLADGTRMADGRWLSVGRTHVEQGFMAINRAIFQPGRVTLSEDTMTPPTEAE